MGALLGVGALLGGVGSLFGGLFGGNAAGKASKQYVQSLQQAQGYLQGLQPQATAPYAPFLNAGSRATNTLSDMLGTPGQGLLTPWSSTFTAPTAEQAAKTPGYQFQLEQGNNALQNSAAGKGSLLSGRTLADVDKFSQGLASENYQQQFQDALTQYQQGYQSFLNNQSNSYSRLLGLSNQGLGAAQGTSSAIQGIGSDIAGLYSQQGAARAQGTIGQASAYGSILPGISGSLMNYGLLSQLFGGGGNANPLAAPGSIPAATDGTVIH